MASDTFNPDEFNSYKAKAALDDSSGFDPKEYEAFKGQSAPARSVWDRIKSAATDAVSVEKHPGLPRTKEDILALAKKTAGNALDAATSPNPMAMVQVPINLMSDLASRGGADVARAVQPTVGTIPARLIGMGTSAAFDPMTYAGAGMGADVAKAAAQKTLQETAPAIMKVFTNTPEAATKLGLASEDALKAYKGTTPEIEGAVLKLQKAIAETRSTVGKRIGDARADLGFATDLNTRVSEMAQGMSNVYPTKEAVAQGFLDLQKQLPDMAEKDALAKLYELRISADALQKSSAFVPGAATSTEAGTLKGIAGEINDVIATYPKGKILRKLDNAFSQAASTYESLQNLMKDPGKAEDMLKKIFTGDRGADREIRKRLATVESVTGKPVMQELFKQYAAQALKKNVGRPGIAGAGAMAIATAPGTALAHPIAGAVQAGTGAAMIASQSPRAMMGGMRALPTLAQAPGAAIGSTAGALGSSIAQSPTARSQRLLDLLRQKARSY